MHFFLRLLNSSAREVVCPSELNSESILLNVDPCLSRFDACTPAHFLDFASQGNSALSVTIPSFKALDTIGNIDSIKHCEKWLPLE